jgi:hypothetical protein
MAPGQWDPAGGLAAAKAAEHLGVSRGNSSVDGQRFVLVRDQEQPTDHPRPDGGDVVACNALQQRRLVEWRHDKRIELDQVEQAVQTRILI